MKKLILIIGLISLLSCEKETLTVDNNTLKYEVINSFNSDIDIIYISDENKITTFTTSENWTNEFVIFNNQSYYIVVESEKECTINLYVNNKLIKTITGKNMIDLNYSF